MGVYPIITLLVLLLAMAWGKMFASEGFLED